MNCPNQSASSLLATPAVCRHERRGGEPWHRARLSSPWSLKYPVLCGFLTGAFWLAFRYPPVPGGPAANDRSG